jgi:D-serine dehydratase
MAPVNRSEKLKRLVAVQRHLEKIAESDLAATTRQRQEVSQTMEVVLDAIGSLDDLHRIFSQHYAERFSRLTIQDSQLAGMQNLHERRVLKERTKGDRLEEQMRDARADEDRESDDNAIYDLIDLTTASSKLQKS